MNPVPAGLPSQSIFLTPPLSYFFFAGTAPEDAAVAVNPNPETRVARRPANALRVKRLENTCVPPFRFSCSCKTLRQCKAKNVRPRGYGNVLFSQDGVSHRRGVNRLACGEIPQRPTRFRVHSFERLCIVSEENQPRRPATPSRKRVALSHPPMLPSPLSCAR